MHIPRPLDVATLADEGLMRELVLVCQEPTPRQLGDVLVLPWQVFLDRLWADGFAE
jgi:hypothetical protein